MGMEVKLLRKFKKKYFVWGVGGGSGSQWGGGGQAGCERRSVAFVKIQKKNFFFGGGGWGGRGRGGVRSGVGVGEVARLGVGG